jgi:16S rRNA (guanine1516-N2)-methyltransferase
METARALAARLGLPLWHGDAPAPTARDATDHEAGPATTPDLLLAFTAGQLELRPASGPRRRAMAVDWSGAFADGLRRRDAARRLPLIRAVGAAHRAGRVLDATAGLGRDAFRLAASGAHVDAAERSPILAALLADGLRRARADPATADLIGDRLHIHASDARTVMTQAPAPDVILIDPMYPDAGRSALPRGDMQALRRLLGPDSDAAALLDAARAVARERVIVKRHVRDPTLGGPPPSHHVVGRSTRFDVYLTRPASADA